MRIAVNCQSLVKNKMEGLGWYSYETLKRITIAHPEHEFIFIFGKGIEQAFVFSENVKAVNIGPPYFRPLAWILKFQFLLPNYLKKQQFDLFLSTDGWLPRGLKIKSVAVIHDINFEHFPEFLPKSFYLYYKTFFKRWAKQATRLATVSEYSKQDIECTYRILPHKIDVTYNGSSPVFKPVNASVKEKIRKKYSGGSAYFVFVGALHPRKNVNNLFKAFDAFKDFDNQQIKLVIVGERFYWNKETEGVYNNLNYKNDIIFTGRLSQEELAEVMGSALALTYVSLFEGFGIPLVEAMNCGIPIITSNTTSMPEIAIDAALIVKPKSVNEIAQAMKKIANDGKLRSKLIEAGNKRKLDFSWDITALKLWDIIEKTLELK